MILHALRLVAALNAVDAHLISAPDAEMRVAGPHEIHHVHDPHEVLLPADGLLPLRLALAKVANALPPGVGWGLCLVSPGRLGGLRGPRELSTAALASADPVSAVVLRHDGGPAWTPTLLGADEVDAVQWQLWPAERPQFDLAPDEAARQFTATLTGVAQRLTDLGLVAGERPSPNGTVRLGPAYPNSSQPILDRALLVADACTAGIDSAHTVLHSHGVQTRERELARLREVCWQVVSAVASWPSHLMR